MAKRTKDRGGLAPHKYLSRRQVKQLLEYLTTTARAALDNGSRRAVVNRMIIVLLLETGLRAAELCALKVRALPMHHGKDVIYVEDGKGHVARTVEIKACLSDQLDWFVKQYRTRARPGSPLFVNERKDQLTYPSLYNRLRTIAHQAGLPQLTPHMLRHTHAVIYWEETRDTFGLQDRLGHADTRTTAVYARTSNAVRRQQIEALNICGDRLNLKIL